MGRGKVRKFNIIWSTAVSLFLTLAGMGTMAYPLFHGMFPDEDLIYVPLEFWEKGLIFAIGFLVYVFAIKVLLFFRRPYIEGRELRYS